MGILAYGSTGAGKTYTMFGADSPPGEAPPAMPTSAPPLPSSMPPLPTSMPELPKLPPPDDSEAPPLPTSEPPGPDKQVFQMAALAAAIAARSLKGKGQVIAPPSVWSAPPAVPGNVPEEKTEDASAPVDDVSMMQNLMSDLVVSEAQEDDPRGLVPRLLESLFKHFDEHKYKHEVAISYIQVRRKK